MAELKNNLKANYSVFQLKAGDKLRNANGKRVAEFLEESVRGFRLRITDSTGTYTDTLTWRQLPQRFPVRLEAARYEIKNLTAEQLQVVMDTLGAMNVNYQRVA